MTDEEVKFVATLFEELKKQINATNTMIAGIKLASKVNEYRLDQIKPYANDEEKMVVAEVVAHELGRETARMMVAAKQKAEDEKGPEYKKYVPKLKV